MKHFLFSALMIAAFSMSAQEFKGLDKSPLDMIQFPTSNRETNKSIRILYSRPQLKGHRWPNLLQTEKYGELVPMKPQKSHSIQQ